MDSALRWLVEQPRWVTMLLVLATALLCWGVAAIWLRSRRPGWRHLDGPVVPRFPVILVHGYMGFDEMGAGSGRTAYFRGVPEMLREHGIEVHAPRLPKLASIAARAEKLCQFIDELKVPKVNIIAHSMGGLDARFAISHLGMATRVASLTTIATPHRGTPLADIGAGLIGEQLALRRSLAKAGLDIDGMHDLTTSNMRLFNKRVRNKGSVRYYSVIAAHKKLSLQITPVAAPLFLFLKKRIGANDGIVPATSQRWGRVLMELTADHWAVVGWGKEFPTEPFYEQLVRELRGRGF